MARRHAKLAGIVDLAPKGVGLTSEHTAAAIVKADAFEVVLLIVPAGTVLKQHHVSEPISFHCLKGQVELRLEHSTVEMKANEWLHLDGGAPHSVRGVEDSSLL